MKRRRKIKKSVKLVLTILMFSTLVFILQKLTKPTWTDGNTQRVTVDERGAHEQQNNFNGVNDAKGINILE